MRNFFRKPTNIYIYVTIRHDIPSKRAALRGSKQPLRQLVQYIEPRCGGQGRDRKATHATRQSLQRGMVSRFRGIGECKIDFGAGWRIYIAKDGLQLIVLLGGGSKKGQQRDIDRAVGLWHDYKQRKLLVTRKSKSSTTPRKRKE